MHLKFKYDKEMFSGIAKNIELKIRRAAEETVEELNGVATIQKSYDMSELEIRTGQLYGSFQQQKRGMSIFVYSNIVYARIQDQGGETGRNYATVIKPTYYFTDGANALAAEYVLKLTQKLKAL